MRISDWSSDVCSSDLAAGGTAAERGERRHVAGQGAGDRGSVRAGVLRDGAAAVPAAVRRHQQAYFATGCQYSTDSPQRSEEHTSELQSIMRNSYAVFCLKKKTTTHNQLMNHNQQSRTYQ